jgi:uncharacterized membrane protein
MPSILGISLPAIILAVIFISIFVVVVLTKEIKIDILNESVSIAPMLIIPAIIFFVLVVNWASIAMEPNGTNMLLFFSLSMGFFSSLVLGVKKYREDEEKKEKEEKERRKFQKNFVQLHKELVKMAVIEEEEIHFFN